MKIMQINSVSGVSSTGRICGGIADIARQKGLECMIAYGRMSVPPKYADISYRIGGDFDVNMHALKSRLFGKTGTYSKRATKRFLNFLDKYHPDRLLLHNLHGYYINFPLLFNYIKSNNIRTVWTLHDCWAFTGHCAYFDMVGCDKWKTGCAQCPQKASYPKSFVDHSEPMYKIKKESFTGIKNMTIVTPSRWLAELSKQSFLSDYEIQVINNGVDLSVFRPLESDVRKRLGCDGKKIVLGVAYTWDARKGLDVLLELARRLGDEYRIIVVGSGLISHRGGGGTRTELPSNVISIQRTNSQNELAKLYSAADVFVNPTREENFGMVNLEALACGTPVITFRTGGSPEAIDDSCGVVVDKNDISTMCDWVKKVIGNKGNIFSKEACVERAQKFDYRDKFQQYISLLEKQ